MCAQDVRNLAMPLVQLRGHSYAVRRLKFSPHSADILASVSYDMTCCLWNTQVSFTNIAPPARSGTPHLFEQPAQ